LFVVDRQIGSVDPIRKLLAGEELEAGPQVAAAVRDGFTAATVTSLVVMLLAIPAMRSLRRFEANQQQPVGANSVA
jgi:hypothetical protein